MVSEKRGCTGSEQMEHSPSRLSARRSAKLVAGSFGTAPMDATRRARSAHLRLLAEA